MNTAAQPSSLLPGANIDLAIYTAADHQQELTLSELLERMQAVAYCCTDSKGNFIAVNDAYENLYGYGREELIGNHFSMVVPEAYREHIAQLHTNFINGEDEVPDDYTVARKDGQLIDIRTSSVRLTHPILPTMKLTLIERKS